MAKNRLDYQAQLSRHSHDVSAGYAASLAPGMIIPQYFDILGPGDSIYYRTHMFARLQDVITAFIGEVDIHIDYFFVPLQMIYTPFGQVFAQTDDFLSALYANMTARDTFPLIAAAHSTDPRSAYSLNGVPEFECAGKKMMRMFDAFDMNPYEVLHSDFATLAGYTKPSGSVSDLNCFNPPVAPWIPMAYHAIYQKYYRNDEFEKFNVASYNVDAYYNSSTPRLGDDIFMCEWVQRPADYFTNTRVSPISSAVNRLGQSSQFPSDGASLSNLMVKVDSFLTSGGSNYPFGARIQAFNDYLGNSASTSFDSVSTFAVEQKANNSNFGAISASNIRALFAVDKFARIYGRSDKTYDDQILAHFGVEIPHDVKHDLTHLKHYRAVLQADPIYGTANTQNNGTDITSSNAQFIGTIGQVGGQGQVTLDTNQEKFTAPVHGVFMCVAYVLTKPRYTETFSKLHLATDRLAFPIPEFDKLGAQPLYGFEHSRWFLQPTDTVLNHDFRAVRRGWQNRYQEWKQKYNRASFLYEDPAQNYTPSSLVQTNIYSPWIVAHQPFYLDVDASATSAMIDPIKFMQNPHALDTVMARKYVSGWNNAWFTSPWEALQSDPILTDYMCYAKKVSWMSETGEPDL